MSRSHIVLGALIAATLAIIATILVSVVSGNHLVQVAASVGLIVSVLGSAVLLGSNDGWTRGFRGIPFAVAGATLVAAGASVLGGITLYSANTGSTSTVNVANQTTEGAALASAKVSDSNDVQGAHDVGSMPTLNQFLSMTDAQVLADSPAGSLTPDEVPVLRQQLEGTRSAAEKYNTVEKAIAGGYVNTTNDVPFMGAHFLNQKFLTDGKFNPSEPEGLLFSKLGGDQWTLVGVWYLILPGVNHGVTATTPPEGFAGNLDLWHQHYGLCTRAGIISENNTKESCDADGGKWTGDLRWMMHAWVVPETAENPNGVFAYLNNNLFKMQSSVTVKP
jgi:hypothetical protein